MAFWKTKHVETPAHVPEQRRSSESETAHARALANLERQRAQGPEVKRVADNLRDLRKRNHFADQIKHLLAGGHA